ncbi:MAG: inositol monophosphatase [Candidatus Micrarchaeota archaeon]|nr:inositol monophosphatase [Candidatus Micrarchaeota archaeon]
MSMIDLEENEKSIIESVKKAGKITLDNIEHAKISIWKDSVDIATDIDIKIEKMIIGRIRELYPGYNIVGEETAGFDGKSEYTWVIDPIDGTKNYVKKIPIFSVSLALEKNGSPVIGIVYDPVSDMLFYARKGEGAWLNDKRISVSTTKKLENAVVYMDMSRMPDLDREERKKALKRIELILLHSYRIRSLGSGALGLCYVAMGAYDIFFDITGSIKHVDMAAGRLILEEAGGTFTNDEGEEITSKDNGFFVGTNGILEKQFLDIVR